jgi:hypothetical protein
MPDAYFHVHRVVWQTRISKVSNRQSASHAPRLLAAAFEREFPINSAAFSASAVIRARRRDSLGTRGSR